MANEDAVEIPLIEENPRDVDVTDMKLAEEALQKRTYDLGKRVKELDCLYNIARLIEKQDISLEEILQGTINLIPAAFQYPEITCVRIILEGKEFRTENFREATWKLTHNIRTHSESIGTLEVSYLDQRPERDEGPFLKEESALLKIITERLGHVTERKKAEEKIKEYSENLERMVEERTRELNRALYDTEQARDRIDGILKSIADGLIVTDLYNRIILMNRAAEDLLGVRLSEVIDRPIDFAIDDRTLRERIKNTLNKKQEGYEFDFELPEDGAEPPRIIRARTSMIKGKTGKHTGIITIMHDVTHEREVDRMKTEFISTTAHELRTPLTSIRGFSEILLRRDDIRKKERIKFLTYINDQSVNLTNIINDLLDISRIESGLGFSLSKAPCDIAEIIRDAIRHFREQSSGCRFEVMLPKEHVELNADRDKIEQVIQNIISNAVKYSPEGGVIQVKGALQEDHFEVSVKDQGIGMTPEQVGRVFEKFYRADASNTAIPGTGKRICRQTMR